MNTSNTYSFENLSIDDPGIDNLETTMSKIYKGASQQETIQATEYLSAFGSASQSVSLFVQLLTKDSLDQTMLLAAIMLNRVIGPRLANMSNEDRQALQSGILSRFFEEPSKTTKKGLAGLIGVIMKKSFEFEQRWTEPLVILSQKMKATQPEETRLEGFLLLSAILDSHISPQILECFGQSLQEEDEDTIGKFLEMLHTLTQQQNQLFDNNKLTKLLELFCTEKGLLSKTLNTLHINSMIDITQNILLNYKSVITKSDIIMRKIIEAIFTLACRKESKDLQDKKTVQETALYFIGQAGQYLPKEKSYPIFKEYLVKMFGSDNDEVIAGAFLILGELAEGCTESLKRDLPSIMESFIQKGLESTVPAIKWATLHTINMFASYLVPEFISYHPKIIPVIIKNLDTSNQASLLSNVRALAIFCDEMEDSIIEYIPELIPRLISIVDKPENSIQVKSTAIDAIASCAEAASDKFTQYASVLIPLLSQLITITDQAYIGLKSKTIRCIDLIISRCLKDNRDIILDSIGTLIGIVYEASKSAKDTKLRENCFVFFYNVAGFLGTGFKPYLEKVIELAFSTIDNQQNFQKAAKPKEISLKNDDDSDDDDELTKIVVDDNALQELAAAICCLGEMALACPVEYVPYSEKTVAILCSLAKFFSYSVRIQVLKCYKNLAFAIIKLGNGGEIPKFTAGIPCDQRFSEDAEKFLYGEVYDNLLDAFQTDDNIQVLITATEILHEFCMKLGPAAIDRKLEEIVQQSLDILTNNTTPQNQAYNGEEEVHGELFGATILLVDLLAKTCRDGFITYFDKLYPELKKFTLNENIPEGDIAEVIGSFNQAVKYVPSAAQIYGLNMLEICIKALELDDDVINNNVACCMGTIVEVGKEKIYDHYGTILQKLKALLENSTSSSTHDKVIASLCRMVYTNPSLVPLNIVVPNLLNEMPLREDLKENRTCIKMLTFLLEIDSAVLSGFEGKCAELLIDAIAERKKYKIKDENIVEAIGVALRNLSVNENVRLVIQDCIAKLPQENVEILTQLQYNED